MKQNRQLCSVPANHPRIGASAPFSDGRFNVSHAATSSSMATEPVNVVAEDASASESDKDHSSLEMGTSEGIVSDASTVSTSFSSLLDKLLPPAPAV